jgi:hypothetical protein
MSDIRRGLLIVWLMVALLCGAIVAAPFIAPPAVLAGITPQCEARARNSSCPACGLTTGFIAISAGRWREAQQANAGAVPLFWAFSANFAAALVYCILRLRCGGNTCK